MRLGVVTTSYPRHPGDAAGSFVAELNRWIERAGHTLDVVAAGPEDDSAITRIPAPRGLFYTGGAPEALASGAPLPMLMSGALFSLRVTRHLRKAARHWDGMIAHWLTPSALACVISASRKPIWAVAHGGDVHLLASLGLTRFAAALLDRPNLHLAFVSKSLQDTFANHAGPSFAQLVQRSSVCSMGVDLEHFRSLKTENSSQNPCVLFLGRLVPIKGCDLFLESLRGLGGRCRIVVAGSGPQAPALRLQAKQAGLHVEWAGQLDASQRDDVLRQAQVVVMPSRRESEREEGMPLVALEALAVGAQLIVSDTGGLAEIPASVCHRVPAEDVPALRRAVLEVLDGKRSTPPGHWLEERNWPVLLPALLPGLT